MHPVDRHTLRFYERVGHTFSQTRRFPWRGWHRLPLPAQSPLTVLDVGCGNGRLYPFLAKRCRQLNYVGVDFSPTLLDHARDTVRTSNHSEHTVTFLEEDIHALPPSLRNYDRIFVFGVMHHVAHSERRRRLIHDLADRLAVGGQLWLTLWQFAHDPRFSKHRVSQPDDYTSEPEGIWMNFSGEGQRYCVDVPPSSITQAATEVNLHPVDHFLDDGKSQRLNIYLGFQR